MRNWTWKSFEKRRRTLPEGRDEVGLDREPSRRVHGEPVVPGFIGIALGVLPVARAGAQRAIPCQPGPGHQGGGHPSVQPPQRIRPVNPTLKLPFP